MKIKFLALTLVGLLLSCTDRVSQHNTTTEHESDIQLSPLANDVHSYSNPNEARIVSAELDLAVDFSVRKLTGSVIYDVLAIPSANDLILDTRGLNIDRIELLGDAVIPLTFSFGQSDQYLGSALKIALPPQAPQKMRMAIHYSTDEEASGLQWLNKEQTAGKAHPFLFSQSQAVHARSWLPVQDTPGVRFTYRATIKTPVGLRAVMSASNDLSNQIPVDNVYHFEMPQAIPSYLLALAVGNLQFKAMSERTGVFAEPEIIDSAVAEFADTEEMLRISEGLYGSYRWGRYDLLILPPSFPFGGMENPRLSFITPTVIAGDKSLVSLIAHELAHSWSGNLVSNATWRDLWLNEGFTSFLTTRIMEAVYGKNRADMEYYLDYQALLDEMKDLPSNDELLAIDLSGRDPDDVFSGIPYTKGQMFLGFLEKEFGREKFDRFLREYFDHFGFQSISTDQFIAYLQSELLDPNPGVVSSQQIEQWIFEEGLPDATMVPISNAFDQIAALSAAWLDGTQLLDDLPAKQWSVHEWLYFLNNLPAQLNPQQMQELDRVFGLSQSRNNEIVHSWLRHVIRHNYEPGFERLENYLVEIGRRKLIVPLYEDLSNRSEYHEFVRRVYDKARPGYHPLAQVTLDKIVP